MHTYVEISFNLSFETKYAMLKDNNEHICDNDMFDLDVTYQNCYLLVQRETYICEDLFRKHIKFGIWFTLFVDKIYIFYQA